MVTPDNGCYIHMVPSQNEDNAGQNHSQMRRNEDHQREILLVLQGTEIGMLVLLSLHLLCSMPSTLCGKSQQKQTTVQTHLHAQNLKGNTFGKKVGETGK